MTKQRYILLDRDGTVIVNRPYLGSPHLVELIPGAAAALRRLYELGYGLVMLTNQSGIGRGLVTIAQVHNVHLHMMQMLGAEGVWLDGIYFCPHRPDENCQCRKPRPGLARRAARELHFDLEEAVVIGDNVCDIELAEAIGAPSILVKTGHGARVLEEGAARPDFVADHLAATVEIIQELSPLPDGAAWFPETDHPARDKRSVGERSS